MDYHTKLIIIMCMLQLYTAEPLNKGHIRIRSCREVVLILEAKINQIVHY